jgi:hypothetical protein
LRHLQGKPLTYVCTCPVCVFVLLQLFNTGNPLLQMAMFVYDRVSNALLPSFLTTRHNRAMP